MIDTGLGLAGGFVVGVLLGLAAIAAKWIYDTERGTADMMAGRPSKPPSRWAP